MEKFANAKIKLYILVLQPRENETDKANRFLKEKYSYKLHFFGSHFVTTYPEMIWRISYLKFLSSRM